jgi:hypothetical protein
LRDLERLSSPSASLVSVLSLFLADSAATSPASDDAIDGVVVSVAAAAAAAVAAVAVAALVGVAAAVVAAAEEAEAPGAALGPFLSVAARERKRETKVRVVSMRDKLFADDTQRGDERVKQRE